MSDSLGPVPHVDDVPRECGRVWGYHREHYCVEPDTHNQDPPVVHFCDCDDEMFEEDLLKQEAES